MSLDTFEGGHLLNNNNHSRHEGNISCFTFALFCFIRKTPVEIPNKCIHNIRCHLTHGRPSLLEYTANPLSVVIVTNYTRGHVGGKKA